MKSKTNIFLSVSLAVAIVLSIWIYYQLSHRVGDLSEIKERDHDFQVCDEDKIAQYYGMNTSYEGGKRAIKKEILHELQDLEFKEPGLITYRFIVNCKGEIGRLRYRSTDTDLNKNEIDPGNIQHIEKSLLHLKNWNPATNKEYSFDSYYVLNFKIRDNKISDIF